MMRLGAHGYSVSSLTWYQGVSTHLDKNYQLREGSVSYLGLPSLKVTFRSWQDAEGEGWKKRNVVPIADFLLKSCGIFLVK